MMLAFANFIHAPKRSAANPYYYIVTLWYNIYTLLERERIEIYRERFKFKKAQLKQEKFKSISLEKQNKKDVVDGFFLSRFDCQA